MKILIVNQIVGNTAPGIVFERLISELSKLNHIDLLCVDCKSSILQIDNIYKIAYPQLPYIDFLHRLSITFFGLSIFDLLWAMKAKKYINNNYDIIFSFVSYFKFAPLELLHYCKGKSNSKLAIYFVDAIPAPIGWLKNDLYYYGLKRMIRRTLQNIDYFASSNQQMLDYQLSLLNDPVKIVLKSFIFTPSLNELKIFPMTHEYVFLFTGNIYGVRKVKYLFEGFKKILSEYPSAKLQFIGSNIDDIEFDIFSEEEKLQIIILPFEQDLSNYYKNALALIDVDADIENDVFLSSKIVNYITIDRLIISETGRNSPSKNIFKNIPSILQCNHDSQDIYESMKYAIENKDKIDYSDRNFVVGEFRLERVVFKLNKELHIIYENAN